MKLWSRTLQRAQVQQLAYAIWERRIRLGEPGTAEDDWREAENWLRW
jgi:hypothetical protein